MGESVPQTQKAPERPRVLVVDDERTITMVLQRALRADYDVDVANDGVEALERLVNHHDFNIILCDLMMPRMTGAQLYAEVERRWPHLVDRFVFMTGGVFTDDVRVFLATHAFSVVDKPFEFAVLRERLASHLGR